MTENRRKPAGPRARSVARPPRRVRRDTSPRLRSLWTVSRRPRNVLCLCPLIGRDRKRLEVGAVSELQGIGRFKFHEVGKPTT
jgi:hypothetical protein